MDFKRCGLRHGGTCENPEPLPPPAYDEWEPEPLTSCQCSEPPHRPPCSWCENLSAEQVAMLDIR